MTIRPYDVSVNRRFDEMTFRENDVAPVFVNILFYVLLYMLIFHFIEFK